MSIESIIREHRSRLAAILNEVRKDINKARRNDEIKLISALLCEKATILREGRQALKLLK